MQYRKLNELKKLPNNPRIIRDKQFKTLCDSIRDNPKYFEARPIILSNRTGEMVIIAGNQRYEAAKSLKLKEVPTFLIEGLDEAKEREIIIRDNISNGEFDFDLLANEWSDLPLVEWGVDLPEDWLKSDAEPADAEPQIDKASELNKVWKVAPGDLFAIGSHRLLCGDSTKAEDVARVMGGEKADFCFTSPPYADMRDYSGGDMSVEKISSFIPAVADRCRFYAINLGLKRQDGEIQPYWNQYISKAKDSGLKLTAWNVWSRAGMGGSIANMTAMFPIEHEWVFVFGGTRDDVRRTKINKSAGTHGKSTIRQRDGSTKKHDPGSVALKGKMGSVFTSCYASGGVDGHPAAFPLEFPSEYIKACSDEGFTIYEPFCGSGTTMVACQSLWITPI